MPERGARRSLTLLLASVLALALAACTGGGDAPPSPPATPIAASPTAPPATATATATATPTPAPTETPVPSPAATPTPSPTSTATPTPIEPPTTFPYNSYDTTGEVAEPGSYAFLANPADTRSAITTYEDLRDGTTTALRIHETDADGVSRAAFLDTVEAGDLFEWRQAEDCFVRYRVTELLPDPSGTPRKLLAVEWMTYAFTGCSGAVSVNAVASIGWAPPPVTSPDITSPIRHGPFLLIPSGWAGELGARQAPPPPVAARSAPGDSDVPAPTWPSTDITEIRRHPLWSEPDVPEGWTRFYAEADADSIGLRYQDRARHGFVEIHISQGLRLPLYNPHIETSPYGGRIHEATEIDGRPAVLRYTPTNDSGLRVTVEVYDYATAVRYRVIAVHWRLNRDYEAVIAIARSLYLDDGPPTPTAQQTTFRYDTYDTTGAVAEPGSYAFLADAADTTTAITTYEGLRDGSATALRIHATDADGVSRAAFLDTVEAGDLFEWRESDDCFVRYRVADAPEPGATAVQREFGVRWETYAFQGCQTGSLTASGLMVTFMAADELPLEHLGGTNLADFAVVHGAWQLVPEGWTGATEEPTSHDPPAQSGERETTAIVVARTFPYWREPTLPAGWGLNFASTGAFDGPAYGYGASFGPRGGVTIGGYYATGRRYARESSFSSGAGAFELLVIAGRPAMIVYSPPGPNHAPKFSEELWIYDAATESEYVIFTDHLPFGKDDVIAIARSLFESPNPLPPPTTFHYNTYDTSGEVAEPGSYAFLADPADTSSAITTYEALRDGTTTALRIHATDADGVSRAAFLDTVEVGDLFEWRQAEDCWVRYRVIGVEAGSDTRDFAIKSYSHTYTGCSGAIGGSAARQFTWAPETLKTGDFPVPTWHGPWLLIPTGWTGPAPDPSDQSSYAAITPPAITWPPDPLPDPDLGPGWRGGVGPGYGELEGHYSHSDGGSLSVYIFQLGRWPVAIYRTGSPYHQADVINEFQIIDGRPARVSYDRVKDSSSDAHVVIYDEATGVLYNVRGGPISRRNDPEATIAIAKKFILPPAGPPPTSFRYTTYDTTGAVAEPGSYAFLANPADTTTAVTTYEGLRDGTTTALRIHDTDADGVSRAAFLDTVEAGDLFEWRQAEDCFVRYRVTELLPDPSGTPRRLLGVEWMTFTYTGCSGAISASDNAQIVWGSLPNLGGESLSVPVIHGAYEIVPLDWSGETMRDYVPFPDYSDPVETDDITVARTLDFWREPTIPEGWTFGKAIAAGGDAYGGARWGYCATWWTNDVKIPNTTVVHPQRGVQICADFTSTRYGNQDASWNNGSAVHETRVIAGRPASLRFSPPGPNHRPSFPTLIQVFDPTTGVTYEIEAIDYDLKSNPEAVVEMARSLFESPNPLPPQTTLRYDRYDTSGAVAEPGSYAFLANPADTTSAVTTYEALRDGTTTALLIHKSDAHGASQAALYDTVEAGDTFEWKEADDCFVRYTVTAVKPDPAGTVPRKSLGVESIAYAFTGCSGAIATGSASGSAANSASSSTASVTWGALPNLGGTSLTNRAGSLPARPRRLDWRDEAGGPAVPGGPRDPGGKDDESGRGAHVPALARAGAAGGLAVHLRHER